MKSIAEQKLDKMTLREITLANRNSNFKPAKKKRKQKARNGRKN